MKGGRVRGDKANQIQKPETRNQKPETQK